MSGATPTLPPNSSSTLLLECTGCFVILPISQKLVGNPVSVSDDGITTTRTQTLYHPVGTISYDDSGYIGQSLVGAYIPLTGALLTYGGEILTSPTAYYFFNDSTVVKRAANGSICTTASGHVLSQQPPISIPADFGELQPYTPNYASYLELYRSLASISAPVCNLLDRQPTAANLSASIPTSMSSNPPQLSNVASVEQGLAQPARIGLGVGLAVLCSLSAGLVLHFIRQRRAAALKHRSSRPNDNSLVFEADGKSKSELDSHALAAESDAQMRNELPAEVPVHELFAQSPVKLKN